MIKRWEILSKSSRLVALNETLMIRPTDGLPRQYLKADAEQFIQL